MDDVGLGWLSCLARLIAGSIPIKSVRHPAESGPSKFSLAGGLHPVMGPGVIQRWRHQFHRRVCTGGLRNGGSRVEPFGDLLTSKSTRPDREVAASLVGEHLIMNGKQLGALWALTTPSERFGAGLRSWGSSST